MKFRYTILDWIIATVVLATALGLYSTFTPQWLKRDRQVFYDTYGITRDELRELGPPY